jgi:TonB family protein
MHVEADDIRPPSALTVEVFSPAMWQGGAALVAIAHLVLPGGFYLLLSVFGIAAIAATDHKPIARELHVVEARFVRLGVKRKPGQLPNRVVPIKSTAPATGVAVSKKASQEPVAGREKKKEEPPPDAAEDLLTRLGDRAQAFAEIAEQREREGDPEGVPWGTDTEGREGDIYLGKLVAFFKNGWTVPTTLSPEELRPLATKVSVQILPTGQVGAFEIAKSSGNALFDQSVTQRLQQLRAVRATVPQPPVEVSGRFLGRTIAFRFLGRDAR